MSHFIQSTAFWPKKLRIYYAKSLKKKQNCGRPIFCYKKSREITILLYELFICTDRGTETDADWWGVNKFSEWSLPYTIIELLYNQVYLK